MDITFKQENNTLDIVKKYELLRLDAFNIPVDERNISSTIKKRIYNADYMVVGLYLDQKLVAGAYVSDYQDSIFIEYIFVKQEYQNCGLKLGRLLLSYINNNYDMYYDFFRIRAEESRLMGKNDKCRKLYEKEGYELISRDCYLYSKKLIKKED